MLDNLAIQIQIVLKHTVGFAFIYHIIFFHRFVVVVESGFDLNICFFVEMHRLGIPGLSKEDDSS